MKQSILILLVTTQVFIVTAANVPFELWNMHRKTIYYGLFSSVDEAINKPFIALKPGAWITTELNSPSTIVAISFNKEPVSGDQVDLYQLKSNSWQAAYVKVIEPKKVSACPPEKVGYALVPQDGPFLGTYGVEAPVKAVRHMIPQKDLIFSQAQRK